MLLFLRNGIARLHTQLAFRHGKVPELFAVLGLLKQLLTLGIVEFDTTVVLLHDGLHILSLHNHLVVVLVDGVGSLGRRCLRNNHQRCRLLGQRILRGGTYADDVIIHYLQTDNLSLTTVRKNGHIVPTGLHIGGRYQSGKGQYRRH